MEITLDFKPIDVKTFKGGIPTDYDLVIVEKSDYERGGDFEATTLYGFDEIGVYDSEFIDPLYGFLKIEYVY